jgi:hypothetical protein
MKSLILAVTLAVSVGAASPYALVAAYDVAFKTQAPVHKEFCPTQLTNDMVWRTLHPECRKYTA